MNILIDEGQVFLEMSRLDSGQQLTIENIFTTELGKAHYRAKGICFVSLRGNKKTLKKTALSQGRAVYQILPGGFRENVNAFRLQRELEKEIVACMSGEP